MTVWREEDLAAAHAGKRLDRRDLLTEGFDHERYAASRKLEDAFKELYGRVGDDGIRKLLGTQPGYCQGYASTGNSEPRMWRTTPAVEIKQMLADIKPAVNLGNAYLVVPQEMKLPEFIPFVDEPADKPVRWINNWGMYGIPVVRSPYLRFGYDSGAPEPKDEPVMPRLMAEHVETEQPKDLSVWQALIFVVTFGTILCLLGGAL